jgi:hypothetical protein
MKRLVVGIVSVIISFFLIACSSSNSKSSENIEYTKGTQNIKLRGILVSKWCANRGLFTDCPLESYVCKKEDCFRNWDYKKIDEELVLFVAEESRYYDVILDGIPRYKLDNSINKNQVRLMGKLDTTNHAIFAQEFKAPPKEKKEFFKGCI